MFGKAKRDGDRIIGFLSKANCDVERTLIHEIGTVSDAASVLIFLFLRIYSNCESMLVYVWFHSCGLTGELTCADVTCLHDGICTNMTGGGVKCKCPLGVSGRHCESTYASFQQYEHVYNGTE